MFDHIQQTITQLNLPEDNFGMLKKHLVCALNELTKEVPNENGEVWVPSLRNALEQFCEVLKKGGRVNSNLSPRQAIENIAGKELTDRLYNTANSQAHTVAGWSRHTRDANEEALKIAVDIILKWRKSLSEETYGPALVDKHAAKISEYKNKLDSELEKQGHNHYITRRAKFITTRRGDNNDGDEFMLRRRPPDLSPRAYNTSGSPEEVTLHHLKGQYPEAVVFIASEGMGKTFEANQLASTFTNIAEKRLCVWLPCLEVSNEHVNSLDLLWGKQVVNLRPHYDDVCELPGDWKIILILDGFDELVDDKCIQAFDTIFDASKSFVKKWKGIVVVTGRDVDSVHNRFDNEFRYALQEFDDNDILKYLNKRNKSSWFESLPRQDKKVASFLRIPFFLSALVKANLDDCEMTGLNRATLLDKYLDELLAHEIVKTYETELENLKKHIQNLRDQLSEHAIGLAISGFPLKELEPFSMEKITFLLNQEKPHTFQHDVVMYFLLAQAVKKRLDDNDSDLFNLIAQRTARLGGTLPLSDAARQTIWSLLLELANNDPYLYPNTIEALCGVDPVLVYFGLEDRKMLPEKYKSPEVIEWNLFQSGLCKCLLGIDPQPEQNIICDIRLNSPEEVLIVRLRDENLRYVATAEAIDAFRKCLLMNPEPWSDLVEALGYEMAFGGQHPLHDHKEIVRYAFGFTKIGDNDGFPDFNTLAEAMGRFLDSFDDEVSCTLLDLDILCRILRHVHDEHFVEVDNGRLIQLSGDVQLRISNVLHDKSGKFCDLTARQVHRLFVENALKKAIVETGNLATSLIQRFQNDKVIDFLVLETDAYKYRDQREEVKQRLQQETNYFQQISKIPPVKIYGMLDNFPKQFNIQLPELKEWIACWSQKLSSWEVGKLVKYHFRLPSEWGEYVPKSIAQSYGWLAGREAVILAHPCSPSIIKVATYSAEQKEYWCRIATDNELRGLLELKVIERNDKKYFSQIVCILLEHCSPVFLRKLLPADQEVSIILSEDFPDEIKNAWLEAAQERPDYNVACRRLGWIHRNIKLSEKLKHLIAKGTGYLHERKYFLGKQLISKEELWEIEKTWANPITLDPKTDNLSLHPFLLIYSEAVSRGDHLFTHPHIKTKIMCHKKTLKRAGSKSIEKGTLFCVRLKQNKRGYWEVSNVPDVVNCDIQADSN